jgi:hypothetical protein
MSSVHGGLTTFYDDDASYSPSGSHVDCGSVLPTDTIESILDQTDIHDLLAGSWNNGLRNKTSSEQYYAMHDTTVGSCSPESVISDASDGSFGLSAHAYDQGHGSTSPMGQTHFYNNGRYNEPQPAVEQITLFGLNNSPSNVQLNNASPVTMSANQSKVSDGFLPMLQDTVNTNYATNDKITDYGHHQGTLSELENLDVLPTFPQAFCGSDSNFGSYCDESSIRQGYPCWSEIQHGQQPCYTFL